MFSLRLVVFGIVSMSFLMTSAPAEARFDRLIQKVTNMRPWKPSQPQQKPRAISTGEMQKLGARYLGQSRLGEWQHGAAKVRQESNEVVVHVKANGYIAERRFAILKGFDPKIHDSSALVETARVVVDTARGKITQDGRDHRGVIKPTLEVKLSGGKGYKQADAKQITKRKGSKDLVKRFSFRVERIKDTWDTYDLAHMLNKATKYQTSEARHSETLLPTVKDTLNSAFTANYVMNEVRFGINRLKHAERKTAEHAQWASQSDK